jgi:PAS domain S-box-containing protein
MELLANDIVVLAAIAVFILVALMIIFVLVLRAEVRKRTKKVYDEEEKLSNDLWEMSFELSRLKELYKNAQDEKAKLEYLYENSVFGIITLSVDGEIESSNRTADLLLGGSIDLGRSLLGKKVHEFLAPSGELASDALTNIDDLLSRREGFARFDAKVKAADGNVFDVEVVLQFDNSINKFLMFIHDISQRKVYEEYAAYEKKIEPLEKLAASLSHDLNNIVGSIMGYVTLLKKRLSPGTKEFHYADVIDSSAKRITELTKQVLGFSHLDAKTIEVLDLNRFVYRIARDFEKIHGDKYPVVINVADEPAVVRVSVPQLEQVFHAILDNAAEAMENGGNIYCSVKIEEGSLDVRGFDMLQKPSVPKWCVVEIEDHGVGMDEAVKRRIFEPFFTTKRVKKYTGLSLSAAFNIVKHHRGNITVDSTPGEGTTVRVFLPPHLERVPPVSDTARPPSEIPVTKGEKILVVDDEESFRQLGFEVLSEQGYEVVTASNGVQALERLKENSDVRVVVLDMVMPIMGGKETCIEIKKMSHPPKILICTGFSELSDLEVILGTYAEGLLQKPYAPADLVSAVRKLL